MSGVVAIVSAAAGDGRDATEFLRVLAALRALDVPVALFEAGRGVGALSKGETLDEDAERYLEALRDDGVAVRGADELPDALASATAVLRLADPARTGVPAVLEWPHGRRPTDSELASVFAAGQIRVV